MPTFQVFFSDGEAFGIHPIQAMDAGHAVDIAQTEHPNARLAVVDCAGTGAKDRYQRLIEWLYNDKADYFFP